MNRLYDNHGRPIDYLRLSVTDRCNLRCFYCMPEQGIKYLPRQELLSYEELYRIVSLLAGMGVKKVRVTGGEPFVRNDLIEFIGRISKIKALETIGLTTNGVLTLPYLPVLKKLGVRGVNLSLDTLDKERFVQITRRDEFDKVWQTLEGLLEYDFDVKINMVVMDGKNEEDIIPMAELTKRYPVALRFIEEMPFNGGSGDKSALRLDHARIREKLESYYGASLSKIPDAPHSTAYHYAVRDYKGVIGIIAAFSRTFCGSCNRIRITAQGALKTCLYDNGVLDIKSLIRSGISDKALTEVFLTAFQSRAKDGFEAEERSVQKGGVHASMSTIGG